jgi:hypothetical protein
VDAVHLETAVMPAMAHRSADETVRAVTPFTVKRLGASEIDLDASLEQLLPHLAGDAPDGTSPRRRLRILSMAPPSVQAAPVCPDTRERAPMQ